MLQEKPLVLKREHAELQNMKFIHIFPIYGVILSSWIRIRIRLPNADPDLNPADQNQYGSMRTQIRIHNSVCHILSSRVKKNNFLLKKCRTLFTLLFGMACPLYIGSV